MSRRLGALVVVAALSVASVGCGRKSVSLPSGNFAGSDRAHRAVTLDVGKEVVVNRLKFKWQPNGDLKARFAPRATVNGKKVPPVDFLYRCKPRLKGEEIRCRVTATSAGRSDRQTIDFMRL